MSAAPQIDWSKYETASSSPPQIDFSKYESAPTSQTVQKPQPRTLWDTAKDFGSELWKQVNPVAGVKGAAQLTSHPVQTYMQDADARQQVYQQAEDAFKNGNYTEGAAHLLYSVLPFVGPQMNQQAQNFLQGNYAKGAGGSVGMGLSLAAPEAVKNLNLSLPGKSAAQATAERVYQTSLKPPPASYTPAEVQSMVKTGLENEIPISAAGKQKLADLVTDLNTKVKAQIQAGSNAGATVNKFNVASRLGETANKFSIQVTPESDLQAVSEAGNEFLRNQPNEIPASQAQALKSGTYQQLGGKSYGELSSASVEAQKALARGIKEELQTQFPEIQGLNAQESKLLGLDEALERAVNRTTNRDIFSLGGKIMAGAGAAVGGAVGGGEGATLGAVAGPAMHYILTDPAVSSKLAIALSKASKGTLTIGQAQSRVGAYTNALGNAIAKDSASVQGAQPATVGVAP